MHAIRSIHPRNEARGVIDRLKKRQYHVGIVSLAFSPVVHHFADILGIDRKNIICPILATDDHGKYSGEVIALSRRASPCCKNIICKADAARALMKRTGIEPEECIAVGDGKSDACLFRACGLSLAYKPQTPWETSPSKALQKSSSTRNKHLKHRNR